MGKEKTGDEKPKKKKVKKHTLKEKTKEKLKGIDTSLKVWVGGLKPETSWKAVEKHFATAAKPKATHVMNKGTACLAYETTTEVAEAIATFNGSELNGQVLEVDAWERPE